MSPYGVKQGRPVRYVVPRACLGAARHRAPLGCPICPWGRLMVCEDLGPVFYHFVFAIFMCTEF